MSNYFDLQVNGYGGVDFNQDDLTFEKLHAACTMLAEHGSAGILATIITEDLSVMAHRLRKLVELREQSPLTKKIIAGLHIEGPFINPTAGYRGAHPPDAIRSATVEQMKPLLEAGGGLTRLVTLAPEQDENLATTRYLKSQNVTIAAGHSDTSLDQLRAAIDAGLTLYTHLGNGCPMQMHRHDNVIQRALSLASEGKLTPCFIADGVHIPFFSLRNYLRVAGVENCIIVTDAVAPAGLGPGRYKLARWDILIGEDMVAMAPDRSHFVGAAITMPQTVENLRSKLGMDLETIQALTSTRPMRAVGMK